MPSWPIEMPSLTAMVLNSNGKPPASRTPSLARLARRSSGRLHGVTSFHDDATPICGLSQSSSVMPTARSIARAGARSNPSVTSHDRGFMVLLVWAIAHGGRGYALSRDDRPQRFERSALDRTSPSLRRGGRGTRHRQALGRASPRSRAPRFTIHRGVTGLLGTNGAGKTTLLGMMLGLHRPTEGTLSVLGLDPVHAGAAVRARVGYSPEHHTLPPDITRPRPRPPHRRGPRPPPPRGHRPGQRRAVAGRARRGALPPDRHDVDRPAPAGEAGPGHRPRPPAGAARRADRRPRPGAARRDAGADPPRRHRVRHRRLLSSHLLEEVERVCDSAVILAGGEVVASGPINELTGADRGLLVEVDDRCRRARPRRSVRRASR